MDFITLANAAHETSRHVFRMLATTAEYNEDNDDFAHLENIGGTHHHHEDVAGSTSSSYTTYAESTTTQSNGIPQMENRPLLSPTAESALLELSTNFLLYCAMVLITTMVAKIYFPSWLEPREEPQRMMSNHAYMNVMDNAYQSDFSDEDEEEEDDDEDFEVGRYRDSTNNGSSTISNTNKEDVNLLDAGGQKDDGDAPSRMSKSASSSFLFDYNQESKTKNSVYTNLALCAIMLNVTFVSWGLLQVSSFVCCSWILFDEYQYHL